MKVKRFLSVLLCFCMLLTLPPTVVLAAGSAPDSGSGTPADPYIIDEPSELIWMSENYSSILEKYFRQTADLDMSGLDFVPIGNGTTGGLGSQFTGEYDGQSFEIKNLTINSNLAYIGLFQYLVGTVKNVTLTNASITSTGTYTYSSAAGIAGYLANGTIQNCGVSGSVSLTGAAAYSYTAGIAGSVWGTIQDCYSRAALSNANSGGAIGGIAAYTGGSGVNILRCYFAGSISGAATTKGGIIGNDYQGTISNNIFLSSAASYGRGSSSGNTGCTPANAESMKGAAAYTALGWDFTNIWKINEGVDYPVHNTAPSKPANLVTMPDDGQVTLSWDAAERATGYRVYYGTSPGVYGTPIPAPGTSAVITGLENGTTYYFAVRGLHMSEEGPLSDPVTCSPHDMITDLAAVPEDGRVELTFSAPIGANTVKLQQSDGGGPFASIPDISLTGESTSATVTGLVNGSEYSFRLRLLYGSEEYFSNTVTVYAGNGDAALSALTVSGCDLSPAFAPDIYNYSATVAPNVTNVTVTATVRNTLSTLWVASTELPSGTEKTVDLTYGTNNIYIWVYAQNGDWLGYRITITRQLPSSTVIRNADAGINNVDFPPLLYVGEYSDIQENAALKFDLSSYSAAISYAELRIYTSSADCLGSSGAFDLYGSDDDSWTSALPSHDAAAIRSGITRPNTSADCWITMDVTDYVKNHLSTKDSIVTFYLEGVRNENDIAFYPSDSEQTEYRPCMVLVFKSDDARLSGISIDDMPLSGFSPDTYTYSYVAPHGTDLSGLNFMSTVNDGSAAQGDWTYDAVNKRWTVTVTAEDGTTQKTYTVTVTAAPAISVTGNIADTGIWAVSIPLTITAASESGIASVKVNGTDITASYLEGYTVTANGDYIFTVTSNSGQTASQTIHITQIDETTPEDPDVQDAELYTSAYWYRDNRLVYADFDPTLGGVEKLQYNFNSTGWTDGDSVTVDSEGIHTLQFRVIDVFSRTSSVKTLTVQIDKTAPAVEISFVQSPVKDILNFTTFKLFFNSSVDVSITATESGSGLDRVEYQKIADGDAFDADGTWTTGDSLNITPDFKGTIYARAADEAGNVSEYVTKSLVTDTTVPTIGVDSTNLVTTDPNAGIYYTVTDSGAGISTVSYQINSGAVHTSDLTTASYTDPTTSYAPYLTDLPDGNYDVAFNAQDNSGNTADTVTVHVSKDTSPKVTSVTVTPGTIEVQKGNTQMFSATVIGENSPAQTVTWSVYGNGSSDTTMASSGTLTVATDETAEMLTVRATSTLDTGKYGEATVSVTAVPPSISPELVNYDLGSPGDVITNITWNSASTVTDVVYGVNSLTVDIDYTVSTSTLYILDSYLSGLSLSEGDTLVFDITFDIGATAEFTVNVVNNYIPSGNADLSDLKVGGATVSGFDPDVTSYDVELPYGTSPGSGAATVDAAADDTRAAVTITQAASLPGTATVEVTAEDGKTIKIYTIHFTLGAEPVTTYTVTFSSQGLVYATKNVTAGASLGNADWPVNPTRTGYGFGGWYTGESGSGTQFTSATTVNADITIYAKWTADRDDSDEDDDRDEGGEINTPSAPTQTYDANVSVNGTTSAALPVNIVTGSGSAAVNVGTQQGNDIAEGRILVIDLPSIPDAESYTLEILAGYLSGTAGGGAVTFNTDVGSVNIPGNMLSGMPETEGKEAGITIGEADKNSLPDDLKEIIGDRPLIRLTLSIDGKQTNWSNPNAAVTVSIPYTPTAEELANPESIVIWYIDGLGNVVTVPNGHYDPVTGTVIVDVTHFSDYAVAYNRVSFKDVAATAWYNKAVSFIAAREITTGTGNGNYSPDAKLTRGEFMVMLMKAYGIEPDTSRSDNFTDGGSTYYTGYLAAAKRLGISAGVGNNMFAPGKEITRQEMFTLLYNALKVIGQLPQDDARKTLYDFSDAGQIESWAKDAMTLLAGTGIIEESGEKLIPTSTVTRAELAQVLYNLMSR